MERRAEWGKRSFSHRRGANFFGLGRADHLVECGWRDTIRSRNPRGWWRKISSLGSESINSLSHRPPIPTLREITRVETKLRTANDGFLVEPPLTDDPSSRSRPIAPPPRASPAARRARPASRVSPRALAGCRATYTSAARRGSRGTPRSGTCAPRRWPWRGSTAPRSTAVAAGPRRRRRRRPRRTRPRLTASPRIGSVRSSTRGARPRPRSRARRYRRAAAPRGRRCPRR